jgi:hypothetical protein
LAAQDALAGTLRIEWQPELPRQHVRRAERQDAQSCFLTEAVYDLVYRAVAPGGYDQAVPC